MAVVGHHETEDPVKLAHKILDDHWRDPDGTECILARNYLRSREGAFKEAAVEARRYAGFYPQSSDGRNTFILFAEWAEGRAAAADKSDSQS